METLIGIMPGLITRGAVYAGTLVMLLGGSLDRGNSLVQFIIHFSVYYRVPDVVTQVEGTNEEAVDRCLRNGIDLSSISINIILAQEQQ